jgi:Kdo2-lipid IVA lauroyltransferase/acyltransferase
VRASQGTERGVTARDRLEYAAVRGGQAVVCALPAGAARGLGAFLGDVAFSVLRVRRAVTMRQLSRALGPAHTERELQRIAREAYRNFGRMTFEYARFPRLTKREVEATVRVTGGEHLTEALAGGKGAILVAAHFGNWELAATLAMKGYPVSFLVGEQHNTLVDGLMNRLRQRFGVETIPLTGSLRGVFRALRANRIVAMLSDQDAGKSGIFVDFFGMPASTPYGPARFAIATGAPLVPGVAVRHPGGHHELVIAPTIAPATPGMPPEEAARLLTQAYTSVFEDFIRRHPDHYFWMHRRWKTRPDGSREPR